MPEQRAVLAVAVPAMNALADTFAVGHPVRLLRLSRIQIIARLLSRRACQ
jgi:hypothetical protein